jgi:tryptophanyl-tRNA synthetase
MYRESPDSTDGQHDDRSDAAAPAWWRGTAAEDETAGKPELRSDGGTAEGADETTLDPWGSATVADYRKLFEEFGIEEFDDVLDAVPNPHYLMRRGVIFGHRDYDAVADAMRNDEPFAALSGFMPTGEPHIGHKLVFDEIIWHQEQGGDAYGLIADLEAHSAREIPWDEIDEHATDYVLSLLALGFDPEEGTLYRQSENRAVQDLAFELGAEANFSELQAIYDFDGGTDVSHMQSVVTQMADIMYPQLVDEPKPTVIPVGPDQDPHVRLARDLAARVRFFGVTEAYASFEADPAERELLDRAWAARESYAEEPDRPRCVEAARWLEAAAEAGDLDAAALAFGGGGAGAGAADAGSGGPDAAGTGSGGLDAAGAGSGGQHEVLASAVEKLENAGKEPLRPRVRILDRNATEAAFDALIEAIEGEKRVYDEHVDAFDLSRADAEELSRGVEVDHGGYGFRLPSSIYHRFMTGLTGGKMSSSVPASHISLLDDPEDGYDKVKSATTGGRETAEKQRELGGRADECPVYELYAYLLAGDDDEFATEVYEECVGGERLCGGCKEQAAELMEEFLEDHQEKRAEWEAKLDELDIELDSPRKRA